MKTVTCKFPEKLDAALEAFAQEEGLTKSEVVRRAVEARISKRSRKRAPRAWDLAKDLCGSVDLPADILMNPKYMEDFGA